MPDPQRGGGDRDPSSAKGRSREGSRDSHSVNRDSDKVIERSTKEHDDQFKSPDPKPSTSPKQ